MTFNPEASISDDGSRAAGPRAVLCAGLYSSGSTWIYNVVRRLAAGKSGLGGSVNVFADDFDQVEDADVDDGRIMVIKSHAPSRGMRIMARTAGLPILLSVREPRDAVASLMTRFGLDFDTAFGWVKRSAAQLCDLAGEPGAVRLKYEDGFTADPATVGTIAAALGLEISRAAARRITEEMAPEAVRAMIDGLAASGVFEDRPAAETWDPETHWHPSHVGDGQVGKWRTVLSASQAAHIGLETRRFCRAFGYDAAPEPWSGEGAIDFSIDGDGFQYADDGFSYPEDWGIWTDGPRATVEIPLTTPLTSGGVLQILALPGPSLAARPDACIEVRINGGARTRLKGSTDLTGRVILVIPVAVDLVRGRGSLGIDVLVDGLPTAAELGQSGGDPRRLGLGLMRLSYVADETVQ